MPFDFMAAVTICSDFGAQEQRGQWHPTPVLLPGKSHGWRSLEGCSPWSRWGSGTTEWLHFHFSLSCIGEGNGNPLQCSCLENPRDGGAWWAAVSGVTQSQTRLKWLSSSSGSLVKTCPQCRRHRFNPWVRKIPWRRKWQPTAGFLPGKFHGHRSWQVIGSQRVRLDWAAATYWNQFIFSLTFPISFIFESEIATPNCNFQTNLRVSYTS